MKKLLIALCGTAILFSISTFALAEGGKMHGKMTEEQKQKMEQKKAEFETRLKLTEKQKEQMKALHEESKAKIEPIFERLKLEKAKIRQLKQQGASEEELKAQMDVIRKLKAEKRAIRKANFEKMQALLTPEQQKEFNKMHEEHMQKMKKMKNKKGKKKGSDFKPEEE